MNPKVLRTLGSILFVVGLTYAAWFAAFLPKGTMVVGDDGVETLVEPSGVARIGVWWDGAGTRFAGGIAFMLIGGVMARVARRSQAAKPSEKKDHVDAEAQLEAIIKALRALPVSLPADATPLAAALDHILTEQVPSFLDEREAMIDSLGLARFAEMIGHFATMERATARAWSALTDEAYDEVMPSLIRAQRGAASAAAAYAGTPAPENFEAVFAKSTDASSTDKPSAF